MRAKFVFEGVADVYGEKFGIINGPKEEDKKALAASLDHDILLTPPKNYYPPKELFTLIKNPSSSNNIHNDARGIIDREGNLYVNARQDVGHGIIIEFLEELGIVIHDPKWNAHLPTDFLTVQRYKDTNIFAIGESNLFAYPEKSYWYENAQKFKPFTKEEKDEAVNYFMNKAKEKNPLFRFVNKVIRDFQ
jgi:hypothetical protein